MKHQIDSIFIFFDCFFQLYIVDLIQYNGKVEVAGKNKNDNKGRNQDTY